MNSTLPTSFIAVNASGDLEGEVKIVDRNSDEAINNILIVAAALCIIFSALSCVVINKTRTIPKTACFLSSSLMFFDSATTGFYATRKFIADSNISLVFTLIALGWSYASFVNVAIMALERLIVFQWPYFYMRRVSQGLSIKCLAAVMILYIGSWTGEWIGCFFWNTEYWNIRHCLDPIVIKYMTATFAILFAVILICLVKIIIIVSKQHNKVQHQSDVPVPRSNRATVIVFVCCVNYFFTALINIALVYTLAEIPIAVRRTILDILYLLNGFVDTCVYVLWYKECRYEMFKLLSILVPPLKPKVEQMRLRIFDVNIHTADSTANPECA